VPSDVKVDSGWSGGLTAVTAFPVAATVVIEVAFVQLVAAASAVVVVAAAILIQLSRAIV
jgi:hypothetical protein